MPDCNDRPAAITIELVFAGQLNRLLGRARRDRPFTLRLRQQGSVKDLIESLGVPHSEVDLILVEEKSVDFSYLVDHDCRIRVYPPGTARTPRVRGTVRHLIPAAPQPPRFLLDDHLARLAAYLRLCGFDTLYDRQLDDSALAAVSEKEHRILLSRDKGLLMRRQVRHGAYIYSTQPRRQLAETLERFDLHDQIKPFTRCMVCNGPVSAVTRTDVVAQLPPDTLRYYDDFRRCGSCQRIYWKGSHYHKLKKLLEEMGGLS